MSSDVIRTLNGVEERVSQRSVGSVVSTCRTGPWKDLAKYANPMASKPKNNTETIKCAIVLIV